MFAIGFFYPGVGDGGLFGFKREYVVEGGRAAFADAHDSFFLFGGEGAVGGAIVVRAVGCVVWAFGGSARGFGRHDYYGDSVVGFVLGERR